MEREELEKLEQDLDNIRAWIQKYTGWLKSEHDRDERAKHKRRLEFLQLLEGRAKDKISRHQLANRIKQWKEELSSTAIDPRRRQFVEEMWQAGMECLPFLDAKILQNEFDFSQWILEFDGWEVLDEISKKPAPEVAEPAPLPATPVQAPKKHNQKPRKAPRFTHSADYQRLSLGKATHLATPEQAAIIRCLHQAYEDNLEGLAGRELLRAAGLPDSSKVRNFFQREGQKLYKALIVYDKRTRLYRLNLATDTR